MTLVVAAALAIAFTAPATAQAQAANQILGGFTVIALNSSFVASAGESETFSAI